MAVIDWGGRRVSCAGGGHVRLFPYGWSRRLWARLQKEDTRTGIFYLHPWEIDPGQPRIPGLPLRSRLRHYIGQGRMEAKLTRLLRALSWDRLDRLVDLETADTWSPWLQMLGPRAADEPAMLVPGSAMPGSDTAGCKTER